MWSKAVTAWAARAGVPRFMTHAQPVKLAKSFADADVLGRVTATMNVLIDQEAILNGDASAGKTWKYYDLGPGWCTYDFFGTCPYRLVCPACDFFVPKES